MPASFLRKQIHVAGLGSRNVPPNAYHEVKPQARVRFRPEADGRFTSANNRCGQLLMGEMRAKERSISNSQLLHIDRFH